MSATPAAPALSWLRIRLLAVTVVVTALFVAIGYKAYTVQIRDGDRMRALGRAQYLREVVVPAPRGAIRDVRGVELAVSVDVPSVWVNPREVVDVARSAGLLARALGLDVREVEARLGSKRRFEWLDRRVSPEAARAVRALELPGVGIVNEPRRFYPNRTLAGTVLGFAGIDGRGLEGIELSLDGHLRGQKARVAAVRDGRGDVLLATELDPRLPGDRPTPGATVTLTIDRFLQYSAERALAEGLEANKAKAGIAVVLDPRTSEILAMAALPTFDPNEPGSRGAARNRAVTDAYEPGSVMKVFSIAAAVEANVTHPEDLFDVEGGRLQIGRRVITDTHRGERLITVTDIMKYSSNVGAVKIARRLGKERLAAALRRFGFGAQTGVDLPGERSGRIRDPRRWGESGLATVSYGYGMTATPLQIAGALAAVANGGLWRPPTILRRVVAADGRVLVEGGPPARRVLSEENARAVARMLQAVHAPGGTAEKVQVPGFAIAGKTGTAHKHDPVTKRYAPDRYLSSFMGFAPADDPRLLIVVIVDEPRGERHYGGSVAGPIFVRIAEEGLRYLGVAGDPALTAGAPSTATTETARPAPPPAGGEPEIAGLVEAPELAEDLELPPAGPGEDIILIPDFTGLSVGQALAAARASGVKIEIEGSGRAVRQFPPPGRALKSITCRVTFSPT